jgi:hypothetical protein
VVVHWVIHNCVLSFPRRRESTLSYFFKKVRPSARVKNARRQPGPLHTRVLVSNAKGKTSSAKNDGMVSEISYGSENSPSLRLRQLGSCGNFFSTIWLAIIFGCSENSPNIVRPPLAFSGQFRYSRPLCQSHTNQTSEKEREPTGFWSARQLREGAVYWPHVDEKAANN